MVSKATEVRVNLSILNEWQKKDPMPCHITSAGWEHYANHWSDKVHQAALEHPNCPNYLKQKACA